MNTVSVSAPGKLMLLGEHAVVYGYPCLATAVNRRMRLTATRLDVPIFELESPDVHIREYKKPLADIGKGDIPQGARFVEFALKNFLERKPIPEGIRIEVQQGSTPQYGLGSSSAATVCTLQALSEIYSGGMSKREIFDLGMKTVLEIQGKASGFDVAAAAYGGTFYFVTGGKTVKPLNIGDMPLVVGYTGIKASTVALIDQVADKRKKYPQKVERIFQGIAKLVEDAKQRMVDGDWERVGRLMDFNQDYLRNLGVSSEKLEALVGAAKSAGAWGAKLSGGGGGDCMLALYPSQRVREKIVKAIEQAGGQVIHITSGAYGVQRDTTDPQQEQFIVVDENDRVIGYRSRYDCHHDKNLIHRSVGAIIFDAKGRLLLQKRSLTKDTDPGKWGISSAGHVTKGQTNDEAVAREILEELGVSIPVTFVKKFITHEPRETEMAALYKGIYDGPFQPNTDEVERLEFFDIPDLKEKVRSGKILLSGGTPQTLREAGIL